MQRPTKLEPVINLEDSKALGLNIPRLGGLPALFGSPGRPLCVIVMRIAPQPGTSLICRLPSAPVPRYSLYNRSAPPVCLGCPADARSPESVSKFR